MQQLKNGSTLQSGKYKILKELGHGGFGITYLAEQTMLERKVAIKEFFMKDFCERNDATSRVTLGTESSRETVSRFREKFLKEARNIAKLDHSNIVRILDIFEENGTAYYVMDYIEGESLSEMVKRRGSIPEAEATCYVLQAADALSYIHERKMNHLDIKPANIMLNGKNEAVLIDFGLSKQYDEEGQQTSTTPVGISEGYAPIEQYKKGGVGEFSPQTDIYALGATFFKLLTGTTPPSASDVYEDGVPVEELKSKGVSKKAIDAICSAMKSRKKDRAQSISQFVAGLKGTVPPIPETVPVQEDEEATIVNVGDNGSDSHNNDILELEQLCREGLSCLRSEKYAEAFEIFHIAANQGHARAHKILGDCYNTGIGVTEDKTEAMKWYRKAADLGYRFPSEYLKEDRENNIMAPAIILVAGVIIALVIFLVPSGNADESFSAWDTVAVDTATCEAVDSAAAEVVDSLAYY